MTIKTIHLTSIDAIDIFCCIHHVSIHPSIIDRCVLYCNKCCSCLFMHQKYIKSIWKKYKEKDNKLEPSCFYVGAMCTTLSCPWYTDDKCVIISQSMRRQEINDGKQTLDALLSFFLSEYWFVMPTAILNFPIFVMIKY